VSGVGPGPDGVLVIDKAIGITSHDAVARTRRAFGTRRVGHAGTLDPMATGVLVLGVGRGTRLLTYVVGAQKEYLATIRFGVATSTDDADGEVIGRADVTGLDAARIRQAMRQFTGSIMQVPSTVSAIKVQGKRAYARVRAGEEVVLAPRPVQVDEFTLIDVMDVMSTADPPTPVRHLDCMVRVTCGSGTYVRALARDLGQALGTLGHLTALRRTRVGDFTLDDAKNLQELTTADLMPLGVAAARCLPVYVVSADERAHLVHGRSITAAQPGVAAPTAALDAAGALVAVVEPVVGSEQSPLSLRPTVVFADA
jgi:tRNA pseudouridine55 synthase